MVGLKKREVIEEHHAAIAEKFGEAASSVMPILLIVIVLSFTVSPIRTDLMLNFLVGTVFLMLGISLFSLGAETSMTPIGSKIGTAMTKTKKLPFILAVSFALGFAVTVAEPDLFVLAETVPHINTVALLVTVGIGVGLFLALCMFRIITGIKLRWLLLVCYAVVFALAAFAEPDFLGIAFDSGGVTTGPMTVPFILALGVGVSNIRSDKKAEADSFGLVALSSIGPILAVLLLGFFYSGQGGETHVVTKVYNTTGEIGREYLAALPDYLMEMALSLLPIALIFLLFQLFSLKLSRHSLGKILIGLLYTYIGRQRRLFVARHGLGFIACDGERKSAPGSAFDAFRLVYHLGRAGGRGPATPDRRGQRRRDSGKSNKTQPVCGNRRRDGAFDDKGNYRYLGAMVFGAGLCDGTRTFLFRAGYLHGDRV